MEIFLALFALPFVAVPVLLIFSLRDWAKARACTDSARPSVLGLAAIITLLCGWLALVPLVLSLEGIGINYSTPLMTVLLVLWPTLVAISTGTCLVALRGTARAEAGIAGLVLLLTALLMVQLMLAPWET